MDLLVYLQDSTDDDTGDEDLTNADKTKTTQTACTDTTRSSNVIRRGCIDIISSSTARELDIFSRCIPHRRGHWAGHVKISLDDDSIRKQRKKSLEMFRSCFEGRGISGTMVEHDRLHLSLSKPFSLQLGNIETFVRNLTNLVQQEHPTNLIVECTSVSKLKSMLDNPSVHDTVLLNEDKTRSFLCWKVHPNSTLQRIVGHIDSVMKSYNQPVYYEPAKFHISIASLTGNIIEKLDTNADVDDSIARNYNGDQDDKNSQFLAPIENDDKSSIATNTMKTDGCEEEATQEVDLLSTSSTDSSTVSPVNESFLVPVHELLCTFGTTKEFVIPLRKRYDS